MEYMPKNIRQIGGREERISMYMEDYVSTYLRRMQQWQEENGAAGLLTGCWQQDDRAVPGVFISGAMAISQIRLDGGQVYLSPEAWNEVYEIAGTYFSGQELCGLFVCEGTCRRFRRQALFAAVRECFPDRESLLYLLTEEGEEVVYRILPRGEERLQGYYCYFERNEAMQDYMMDHLPQRKVEWELPQTSRRQGLVSSQKNKEGTLGDSPDPASRFRQKMGRQKLPKDRSGQPTGKGIVALCGVMALVIVAGGMGLAYRQQNGVTMDEILSRLHIDPGLLTAVSVMPEETGEHYVGREQGSKQETVIDPATDSAADPVTQGEVTDQETADGEASGGILVEEIPGEVYPTKGTENEVAQTEAAEPITTLAPETEEPEPVTTPAPETEASSEAGTESQEAQPPETSEPETERSTEDAEVQVPVGTGVVYTVREGDSLYSISRRFYGTEEMAAVIQQMNDLENADLIKVGQELLLP